MSLENEVVTVDPSVGHSGFGWRTICRLNNAVWLFIRWLSGLGTNRSTILLVSGGGSIRPMFGMGSVCRCRLILRSCRSPIYAAALRRQCLSRIIPFRSRFRTRFCCCSRYAPFCLSCSRFRCRRKGARKRDCFMHGTGFPERYTPLGRPAVRFVGAGTSGGDGR